MGTGLLGYPGEEVCYRLRERLYSLLSLEAEHGSAMLEDHSGRQ